MTTMIALAGKGGTGKTTVAALLIKYLIEQNSGTVLAIDADPSANLNLVLGLPLEETIGDIREEMLSQVGPTGALGMNASMSKLDYLDYQIEHALVEGPPLSPPAPQYGGTSRGGRGGQGGVDLLAMGRPEGSGCYCPVNHMLREIIDRLGRSYDYVVIDNEAGLEHLSRRTTRDVDVLLIVTDPTVRGVVAAGRIAELSRELDINIAQAYLVVNRVMNGLSPILQETIDSLDIPLAGMIPNDPEMMTLDAEGRPLIELGEESAIYQAVRTIAQSVISHQ
jgi:CO dehydrogenase maturation factor